MNHRLKRVLLASVPTMTLLLAASGCEIAANVNAPLDASFLGVIDCSICADVSVDADYDAPEVSIYGIPPKDAGSDSRRDTGAVDATVPLD